ncbi:hypothetical protein GJ496_003685 [Pomphorhynchus laevis]|nr:hypothetical protein GJ496_003685 [Pomphorhynchus laevis]
MLQRVDNYGCNLTKKLNHPYINCSSEGVTQTESEILKLGHDFVLPNATDSELLKAVVELKLSDCIKNVGRPDIYRNVLAGTELKAKQINRQIRPVKRKQNVIKSLINKEGILMCRADKGISLLVLDTCLQLLKGRIQ